MADQTPASRDEQPGSGVAPRPGPGSRPRTGRGPFATVGVWVARALPWVYLPVLLAPVRLYRLDLLSHFGPQAAAALAVVGALLMAARCRWMGLSALLASCATMLVAAREHALPDGGRARAGEREISLILYNAKGDGGPAFLQWLRTQDVDMACIIEAPMSLVAVNPWLAERYPHRIEPRSGMQWAMIVLSKFPMASARVVQGEAEQTHWQSFLARRSMVVSIDGSPMLFGGTHPASPRSHETWLDSIRQVERDGPLIRQWLASHPMPALIAGDFNSSPNGMVRRAFGRESGLKTWSPLAGGGTWHARAGRWLGIPIDGVFTGGGVRVLEITVGPRLASDHRPVIARVAVPTRSGAGAGGASDAESARPGR